MKVLIEMILDDVDEIKSFVESLEIIKSDPVPVLVLIAFTQAFVSKLALGKILSAKMLISKTKGARPREVGTELITRWERIEAEIIKKRVNDD